MEDNSSNTGKTQENPQMPQSGGEAAHLIAPPGKMGKTRVIAPSEREMMKLKIQEWLIRGESPTAIWQQLGIDKKTYYRMVDELSKEAMEERLKRTERLLNGYMGRSEHVFRELGVQYRAAKAPSEKARIQGLISNHLHSTASFLQSCGFLPKRTEEMHISGELSIKEWMAQFYKKKVASEPIEASE